MAWRGVSAERRWPVAQLDGGIAGGASAAGGSRAGRLGGSSKGSITKCIITGRGAVALDLSLLGLMLASVRRPVRLPQQYKGVSGLADEESWSQSRSKSNQKSQLTCVRIAQSASYLFLLPQFASLHTAKQKKSRLISATSMLDYVQSPLVFFHCSTPQAADRQIKAGFGKKRREKI
jgi:hypothetical protein